MWVWVGIYILTTILPLRLLILHFEDKMQRAADQNSREYSFCRQWYELPKIFFLVAYGTLFWPFLAALGLYWWLAFPKGRKTKYQKEKEREAELREREQELKRKEREVLQWLPGSSPAEIEAGTPVTLADIEDQVARLHRQIQESRSGQI